MVEVKNILPISLSIIFGGMLASCSPDPRVFEKSPTDVVTITKTTKIFDTQKAQGIVYKSQVGPVKMSHKIHEEQGLKCIDCHHKDINGKDVNPEREKRCAVCHYGENGYKTMHGLCISCHIKRKAGPQQCKECH